VLSGLYTYLWEGGHDGVRPILSALKVEPGDFLIKQAQFQFDPSSYKGFSGFSSLSLLGIWRSIFGVFQEEGFESLKKGRKPGLKSENAPKGPTAKEIQVI